MLQCRAAIISLLILLISKVQAQSCADTVLYNYANNIALEGRNDSSIYYFKLFQQKTKLCNEEDSTFWCNSHYMIGDCFIYKQNADSAIYYTEKCIEYFRVKQMDVDLSMVYSNLGTANQMKGNFKIALDYFLLTLEIDKISGTESDLALDYNNIAAQYSELGMYDKALDFYVKSLAISKKLNMLLKIGRRLNNIGHVYRDWGFYAKAISYYLESYVIYDSLKSLPDIAIACNNLAEVYSFTNIKKAQKYYNEAIKINKKLNLPLSLAINYTNIGSLYKQQQKLDSALYFYIHSKDLFLENNSEQYLATIYNNIGNIYFKNNKFDSAESYHLKAFELSKKLGQTKVQIFSNSFLGEVKVQKDSIDLAIKHFRNALIEIEKIRLEAPSDVRKEYLADQVEIYENLLYCYYKTKSIDSLISVYEKIHSRTLIEQLNSKQGNIETSDLNSIQKLLKNDEMLLLYSFYKRESIITILIEKNNVKLNLISLNAFCDSAFNIAPIFNRGFIYNQLNTESKNDKDLMKFKMLEQKKNPNTYFLSYRTMLSKPFDEGTDQMLAKTSKFFYKVLLSDIDTILKRKKTLIIVPDGVLSFIPFETFINFDNKYLIEQIDVKYISSLTLFEIINNRTYLHKENKILAIGSPKYLEQNKFQQHFELNESMVRYAYKKIHETENRQINYSNIYNWLAKDYWENLPGTLKEIELIKSTHPSTVCFLDSNANEMNIKKMSRIGQLEKFNVLHFATHGINIPEIPELSALILSQDTNKNTEDGYLRMSEIAALNLNADFVNLSACETGLGKLYKGEGVFGLSQSFLFAGANAMSLSLWQVADESTSLFMGNYYEKLKANSNKYLNNLCKIKREFIQNPEYKKWSQPFYWAAFVYYGL